MARHIGVVGQPVLGCIGVFQNLGLGIGITGQQLQALDHFTADLGFKTLGANLAGVQRAATVRAQRVGLGRVFLDSAEQVERTVEPTVEPLALDPQLVALPDQRLEGRAADGSIAALGGEDIGVAGIGGQVVVEVEQQGGKRRDLPALFGLGVHRGAFAAPVGDGVVGR